MKTIIFSDTHLTTEFIPSKFTYLLNLIENADQVIINGDFWDSYVITFDEFLNSEWNQLFPLLKAKNTVYIHGNHDLYTLMDDRVSQFCNTFTDYITMDLPTRKLYITHGHTITPSVDLKQPWVHKSKLLKLLYYTHLRLTVPFLGKRVFFYESFKYNQIINWINMNLTNNEILVSGHTHVAKYDLKNRAINSGFIDYGVASYILIEDDEISLIEEHY